VAAGYSSDAHIDEFVGDVDGLVVFEFVEQGKAKLDRIWL